MTAGTPIAVALALVTAQAIEQIGTPPPRDRTGATEQVASAATDPAIAQLPDRPRDVPQPAPRATTSPPTTDVDRVAAVILAPTVSDDPTRVGSELGIDTIRQVARAASGTSGTTPTPPVETHR